MGRSGVSRLGSWPLEQRVWRVSGELRTLIDRIWAGWGNIVGWVKGWSCKGGVGDGDTLDPGQR